MLIVRELTTTLEEFTFINVSTQHTEQEKTLKLLEERATTTQAVKK